MKTNFYMTSPKFKLTELSILLNLYFLEVLEQVTTNIHTNIHFERVLFFRDLVRLKFCDIRTPLTPPAHIPFKTFPGNAPGPPEGHSELPPKG